MAVFKATKNKKDTGNGTFKATERRSYDSTMVSGWETTNKESLDILNNYNTKIENQEFLSADDIKSYRTALDGFIDSSTQLRNINKYLGKGYTEEEEAEWTKNITSFNTNFDALSKYYSNWETEQDYKDAIADYLAYEEDQKAKASFDLEVGAKEIEDLESKKDEWNKLAKEYDTYTRLSNSYSDQEKKDYYKSIADSVVEDMKKINPLFDPSTDIESIIAEKKVYLRDAEKIQTKAAMESEAKNASDFEEYAQKGAEVWNPTWEQAEGGLHIGSWRPFAEYSYDDVQNKYTYHITNTIDRNGDGVINEDDAWNNVWGDRHYDMMTEEEAKVYNYYVGKDSELADKYLDTLEETLAQRSSSKYFEEHLKGKWLNEYVFGLCAGTNQFVEGVENLFSDKDYYSTSAIQYASGLAREDLADDGFKIFGSSIGQIGYDIFNTTGNMLPSIMVSYIPGIGQVAGSVSMGLSAAGNAKAEMINLGYSKEQANLYGLLVGASEAGLQYLMGGISKLGGKASTGLTEKVLTKVDNAFARTAIKLGGSMASEGLEESLQTILEPWFKSITTGTDFNAPNIDEILYSGLLGALSAGMLEGAGTVGGEVSTYKAGKYVQNVGAVDRLTKLGSTFSADSVAYQLAGRISENTGAYTIGRLFNEVGATLTEQNMSEIIKSLERKGVSSKDAKSLAEWLSKVIEGEALTDKQKAMIESNDVLAKTIADVIINPNSTVNQRRMGYAQLQNDLKAGEKVSKSSEASESSPVSKTTAETSIPSTKGEFLSSGSISVSDDGKTTITNDKGEVEEVSIKEISSIKDGVVSVRLNNGSMVNAKDITFGSEAEGLMYEAVADMNPVAANAMIKGFDPNGNLSAGKYIRGFKDAYMYGVYGFPQSDLSKGVFTSNLSEEQKHRAYTTGKIFGDTSVKNRQDAINKAKEGATVSKTEKVSPKKYKDETHISKLNTKGLTERQKASVEALKVIADAYGINFYFFESPVVNGKRVGKNGYYDPSDRSIHIDLFAGKNGEQVILFTAAHELTHLIKDISPAKFKIFADFLLENYGKKGISVEELVQKQIEKGNQNNRWEGLSESEIYDRAYEEVIADACETMLTDSNAIEKIAMLKAKDKTLWQKIKTFIADLLAKIKKVYASLKPNSVEAQYVREMVDVAERLHALWTDALMDAGETYSTIGDMVEVDVESQSISPMFSERTWTESEYVTEREETAKKIAKTLGVSVQTAYKYIDDINSVARLIADDRARLDYEPNVDDKATVLKPNSEYKWSVDMSTLCAKRLIFTGTFDAIQKQLPNTAFDSDDIVLLRQMMMDKGYEVACGICYVESTRREIGTITQDFISSYKEAQKSGKPITRTNSEGKVVDLKKTKDQMATTVDKSTDKFFADKDYTPTLADLNTTDIDLVKRDHPLVYEAYLNFMNARGQAKPKLLETRAEYKGEILKHFKSKSAVTARNNAGGLRLQSFSDFEVPHLIDMMQITMDMARVGLKAQAYTKVTNFAEAFGNTGIKINLSLIAKGTGLDSKGNLVFDDVEGINHKEAFKLRDKFSKNVGTILVGKNDAHIVAAMADPRIDYIIPFHKSSWKESLYDALGLTGYADYTDFQNEKYLDASRGKAKNFDPSEYWDFTKTGDENAQIYLEKCREDGRIPKFPQFQGYPGYWKLLIDFKMYDNDGIGSPQEVVKPIFDDAANKKILDEYKGGHRSFPEAKDVVSDFVKEYKDRVKFSDREVVDISDNDYRNMYEYFGATNNYDVAGYMLKNGVMLDFSGKHWGDDYSTSRQVDHRDIQEVLEGRGNNGVNAMIDMISNGNIRLMPETGGINLAVMPNSSQISQLRGYINHFRGEIIIDIDEVGGDTIHSWEYNRGTSSAKILSDIKAYFENGTIPQQQSSLNQFRYSDRVTDKETLDFLENQEHVTVYRAMQSIDGKLYPPMNAYTYDENGKKVLMTPSEIGAWEQSVERPDLIDKKTGKFKLDKGKVDGGKRGTPVPAAYNPYIHTSLSMLNDQFTSAYTRSNLVVVKGLVPKSELTSGYKAQYAKDSVGETEWHSGVVSTQLPESRKVILSRWFKPVEIMDNDVVAENIKKMLGNTGIEIPYNVVSPKLRKALEKIGVPIGEGRGIRNLPGKNEVKYSDRGYAPTFYSQMGKVVEGMKQDKFAASSVVSMLRGRGVKAEEIRWSGIVTWLEGKKSVTKQELLEFIEGSQLQIGEQMSGEDIDLRYNASNRSYMLYDTEGNVIDTFTYNEFLDGYVAESDEEIYSNGHELEEAMREEYGVTSAPKWSQYKLDGGENYRELVFTMPNSTYSNRAMRGHWGQDAEGVLVHARIQDFIIDDKKMLFIEELQSDWHNEGLQKGYSNKEYEDAVATHDNLYNRYKKLDLAFHKYVRSNDFRTDPEDVRKKKHDWLRGKVDAAQKKYLEAEKVVNSLKEKGAGDVADAPFKETYHEYVLKRLLRMASEEGYDSIGWTIADTQSKRWSYDYEKAYRIEYDHDMPKFLSKYGRQWGAKVEKSKAPKGEEIWSMELTDSMKDTVLHEGQVMYSDRYSYEALTSKPDMKLTTVGGNVPSNRADIASEAKKNVAKVGKLNPKDGSASVHVDDINTDVIVTKRSLVHGLDRRIPTQAPVLVKIGEVLKNSIKINELIPRADNVKNTYVLIGAAQGMDGSIYVASFVVNKYSNEVTEIDVLYSANTKKESAALLPKFTDKSATPTDSTISIASLLDYVNQYFPDVLPESVLRHFGHTARPKGELGKSALYQDRDGEGMSNRSLLANALETAAKNDIERQKLAQYKEKISLINAEEQKLYELREQIQKIRFTKGRTQAETKQMKSLEFEATQTANRINTYDRQLLTLEASKPLKDVIDREKKMAYKKAEQMGKEAVARQREKDSQTIRELMTRYQESRKKSIEGRQKTEMRHKIKRVVGDLNQLLLRPTKDKHIKEELRKVVAEALSIINMDTVGADERIAKLEAEIARATDPVIIDELTASRDRISLQGENLKDKLSALQTAYEKIKNSEDVEIVNAYQEPVLNTIKAVVETVGDTSIRDMNLEQLESVYDMYSMVLHAVRTANKMFKAQKYETLTQTAEVVNEEVRKAGGEHYKRSVIGSMLRKVGWTFLKPFVAFRTIGSDTFTGLYNNLRSGEDTYYTDIKEAQDFIQAQYEKHGFKKWNLKEMKEFTAKSGKTFKLTLEQMMSLYAYSRREQALAHILEGGIVFDDSIITEKKHGIPVKYEVTTKSAFNLSEETFNAICDSLTTEQRAFVDEMQSYLSDVMGAKGNEVSMELLGVKLFKEKFYFPLKSSQFYMNFKPEEAGEIKLKNPAFSKETVKHANNPVVLSNFTDVWANHINDMSMYHSFVLPLEDFTRVFNYKTKTAANVETMATEATIANAYGKGATKYIRNFLKSLNGGVRVDGVDLADKFISLTKKGAVLASASVTIQQPSAIIRATAYINTKYFVKATPQSLDLIHHKKAWEELKKYAPIAGIKEMGGYDIGTGKGTVDWIKSQQTIKKKVDDAFGKAPAFMDEITWVSIWEAVKRETASNNKDMDVNSEAFLKKAGERFTEVVSLSQVYDSVFSRSDIMRNPNPLAKMLTAFMAEPSTTLNMIVDAFIQGKRTGNFRGFAKIVARNGGAIVGATVLNSMLKSIIKAMNDDDEDESYIEKYFEHFVGDLKDNLNPLTLIPFAKDIVSIFSGYDVERMDMALFSDLYNAINAMDSDSKTEYEKWADLAGAISAFFGIPLKNVERDIRGVYNTIDSFINGEKTTGAGIKNALKEGWTGKEISNAQQLYEAIMSGDEEQTERIKARFKSKDKTDKEVKSAIESAMRKALRENDPRIRQAAQAVIDGNHEERIRLTREIVAEGNFRQDIVVGAINAELTAMRSKLKKQNDTQ